MTSARLTEARGKLARMAGRLNARHGAGCGLPALVLMTDDTLDVDWVRAVAYLPRGSAVVVRHREPRAREGLALRLKPCCLERGIKLLIADDVKLALRVGADGVHLPEARMTQIPGARRGRWLVTVAAHDRAAVMRAEMLGADAVFVSPVFATASHAGRAGLGVVRLAAMSAGSACPVYALGGVDVNSIGRIGDAQVAGVALVRGWMDARPPSPASHKGCAGTPPVNGGRHQSFCLPPLAGEVAAPR